MMQDPDVLALPEDVRAATGRFAIEIARSFPFGPSTAIAIFGDAEANVGEISLTDRLSKKEMQVTVERDGRATVWMRGPNSKQVFERLLEGQMQFLPAVFSALK